MNHQFPTAKVFCWGSNTGGALGDPSPSLKLSAHPIEALSYQQQQQHHHQQYHGTPFSASAGRGSSTVLSHDRPPFSWGTQRLEIPQRTAVTSIHHGSEFSCALTDTGEVLICGSHASLSSMGGVVCKTAPGKSTTGTVLSPPFQKKFVNVGCGDGHVALVLNDGKIMTYGVGDVGQLGRGRYVKKFKRRTLSPKQRGTTNKAAARSHSIPQASVPLDVPVKTVSCGANHTAAVSRNRGLLFTWGWGEYGRLGHGDCEARWEPTLVSHLCEVSVDRVACGSAHTIALTEDGGVWGFGWNMYGQIGTGGGDSCSVAKECLAMKERRVVFVSCGFAHSAAVTVDGELYTWGFNEECQLGLGHDDNTHVPVRVEVSEDASYPYIVSVSCGHTHTVCIASKLTLGENEERHRLWMERMAGARVVIGRFFQKVKRARLDKLKRSRRILSRFVRNSLLRCRLLTLRVDPKHEQIVCPSISSEDETDQESSHDDLSCNQQEEPPVTRTPPSEKEPYLHAREQDRLQNERMLMKTADDESAAFLQKEAAFRQKERNRIQVETERMRWEEQHAASCRSAEKQHQQRVRIAAETKENSEREAAADLQRHRRRQSALLLYRANARIQKEGEKGRIKRRTSRRKTVVLKLPKIKRRGSSGQSDDKITTTVQKTRRRTWNGNDPLPVLPNISTERDDAKRTLLLRNRRVRLAKQSVVEEEERRTTERRIENQRVLEEKENYDAELEWKKERSRRETMEQLERSNDIEELRKVRSDIEALEKGWKGRVLPSIRDTTNDHFLSDEEWGRRLLKNRRDI